MKNKLMIIFMSFIFLLNFTLNVLAISEDEILDVAETQIEEVEMASETKEETMEVEEKKESPIVESSNYIGRMYIDSPSNNKVFLKSETISITGWAVSDDRNATVRLLLDGNIIVSNCSRVSRGDVDSTVSSQYGGTAINPKAGFEYSLNSTNLSGTLHKITAQELSGSGNIIVSSEVQFQIQEKQYAGRMYVETPGNQSTWTKSSNIAITGWAVSNDRNATVRVLVDGNVMGNCNRVVRGDVDSAVSPEYGGTANTPKAGFEYRLNTNYLSTGWHKITVQELSSSGTVIVASEIQVQIQGKQYQGRLYIDSPSNQAIFTKQDDGNIAITGWAVSDDRNATVRVLVDGNVMGNATRTVRSDVDSGVSPQYGGLANTPKAGFEYWLSMNRLSSGTHQVVVQELSCEGSVIASAQIQIVMKNKQYQGKICLETPSHQTEFVKQDANTIQCAGWAVSEDKNATVQLLVDGNVVGNCNRDVRGDVDSSVSPEYGGTANTPKAGFQGSINISQLASGIHKITAQELSRYGDVIASSEIQIVMKNKQYRGTIHLEAPTNQMQLIKQNETSLKVQGWAVSEDREAVVRILLDGVIVKERCDRMERGDVDSLISPQYGGIANTPNAGFSVTLDTTNLMIGNHLLRVEEISRFGDLISANEVILQEINQQYLGEMCLDNPLNGTTQIKGSNLTVAGWAVSQDESARVEIYIDGNFYTTADRYYRQDVTHYMNKYDGKTVNAGFGKLVNTSNMAIGTHTITVYEKSRYGDVIGGISRTFVVKTNAVTSDNNNHSGSNQSGESVTKPVATKPTNPTTNVSGTKGIDVSQFQGSIDWRSVANSDVKYALIRAGYRAYGTGKLVEDTRFKKNFSEATASGLKVGVYLYSAAINSSEAKGDAEYVISLLQKYGYQNRVSMPIAIDLELVSGVNTRDKNVSKATRTSIANTFCQTIARYGYTPMVYACKSFLNDNMYASQVPYDIWVAQYNSKCTYSGSYTIWQYTSSGKIPGINGNVDCNICYKNY